jgi:hypothetical protein
LKGEVLKGSPGRDDGRAATVLSAANALNPFCQLGLSGLDRSAFEYRLEVAMFVGLPVQRDGHRHEGFLLEER